MATTFNCIILSLFGLAFMYSCSGRRSATHLVINDTRLLDSVPSGSGLAIWNDTLYIIGDDATGLYRVQVSNNQQHKLAIGLPIDQYREAKPVKHDLESATIVNWQGGEYLMAFGSGSKVNTRDSMLFFNLSDNRDQKMISLSVFYESLRQVTGTSEAQWNVEGAAVAGRDLVLCNRGNNTMIRIVRQDFYPICLPGLSFRQSSRIH